LLVYETNVISIPLCERVILQNMVVENERGVDLPNVHVSEWPGAANPPITPLRVVPGIEEFMEALFDS
jgi:hypothetical protein